MEYTMTFPEYLIYLFNNSAINNTAINATVDAIVGEGLVCTDNHTYARQRK
jgi:hypothetical protein